MDHELAVKPHPQLTRMPLGRQGATRPLSPAPLADPEARSVDSAAAMASTTPAGAAELRRLSGSSKLSDSRPAGAVASFYDAACGFISTMWGHGKNIMTVTFCLRHALRLQSKVQAT